MWFKYDRDWLHTVPVIFEPPCISVSSVCMMDFLNYSDVLFGSGVDMGWLCKELDHTVGASIWYDTFRVQNKKWLWFLINAVTAMNNDKVLCGVFGLYPCFVAGTLSEVQEINFYVLSNKQLKYSDYIEKKYFR
jgi:hypothetical protein